MADAHLPPEFDDLVRHPLPPDPPVGPAGGRPRVTSRVALKVIRYVPASGVRRDDVPGELGCSDRAAHRRLRAREESGVRDRVRADRLRLLREADKLGPEAAVVDGVLVRAFGGGEDTGRGPVDRGKPGTKHTRMADPHGAPPALETAGANARDHRGLVPLLLAFPRVGGEPGRPRDLPDELYADRGYDSPGGPGGVDLARGRAPHRRAEHPPGSGLGKVRWGVERTISRVKGLRRMRVRYGRLGVTRDAFTTLAASVIRFRILTTDAL